MQTRVFLAFISLASILSTSSALAHSSEPGNVLPHVLTGEHLLVLVLVGLCIAGIGSLYRRFR